MSETKAIYFKHRSDIIDTQQLQRQLRRLCAGVWAVFIFVLLYECGVIAGFFSFNGQETVVASMPKKPTVRVVAPLVNNAFNTLLTLSKTMPEYRSRFEKTSQLANKAYLALNSAKDNAQKSEALALAFELSNNVYDILNNPMLKQKAYQKNKELLALKAETNKILRVLGLKANESLEVKPISFYKTPYHANKAAERNLFSYK